MSMMIQICMCRGCECLTCRGVMLDVKIFDDDDDDDDECKAGV